MKKWNFFARALCVLTLIIFASCNYAGDNSGSNPPETPPADVTNLTATCTASGTVKLQWTNPSDADFAKVVITYGTDGSKEVLKTDTLNNEATIAGLSNGTQYTFTVKAYDNANNASSGVSVNATPHIPTPAELTTAGTRPENVTGSQTLPTFTTNITDHLYLAESSANATGYLAAWETYNASTLQWYTGTTGNWQAVSGATDRYLQITATIGTTYYMLEAKSEDGNSVAYSNVCTVVCGGDKTTNIGKIAYSDGTCSNEYEAAKTPIGIVFDVNADGTPKKIVNLSQASLKMWCSGSAAGCNTNFVTDVDTPLSYTDGSGNWQIICDNVTDANTEGYYPAFEYCNELTDGDKSWYLPARDELMTLYFNRTAVNSAIEKLPSGTATKLPTRGWFWSSSQSALDGTLAWFVPFDDGYQFNRCKVGDDDVRAVAGF